MGPYIIDGKVDENDATNVVVSYLEVGTSSSVKAVSYTHLRAHETVLDLVCRLLLEKKKEIATSTGRSLIHHFT